MVKINLNTGVLKFTQHYTFECSFMAQMADLIFNMQLTCISSRVGLFWPHKIAAFTGDHLSYVKYTKACGAKAAGLSKNILCQT